MKFTRITLYQSDVGIVKAKENKGKTQNEGMKAKKCKSIIILALI